MAYHKIGVENLEWEGKKTKTTNTQYRRIHIQCVNMVRKHIIFPRHLFNQHNKWRQLAAMNRRKSFLILPLLILKHIFVTICDRRGVFLDILAGGTYIRQVYWTCTYVTLDDTWYVAKIKYAQMMTKSVKGQRHTGRLKWRAYTLARWTPPQLDF